MARSNKILICIPSYTFGGAEIHSLYTAKAIQKNSDNEVYFLAFGRIDTFKSKLEEEGFNVLHFNLNNFLSLSSFKKCIQLFKLFIFLRPFKFKYIFSGTEQCNLLMGLTWKFLGVKKFFWHQWGISSSVNTGFWEKLVAKTNPTYIANSEACKQNLLNRHSISDEEKVIIIHNTFNEEILKVTPVFDSNFFNIVMLANFYDEKDHETVLRALKLFVTKYTDSNIVVYFAGRDNGSHLILKAKALAFDLYLNNHVVFEGLVENVSTLLEKMTVGILSTKSEGLSNALIEYLAAGLPIIATNISQNREAVGEENANWLFPIGDEKACFNLIEKLFLNRSNAEKKGRDNKLFAESHFSNKIYDKEIMNLIKES